ncbi:hypothetical protein GCM10010486_17940 [Nonomuraea roseoviolacea subsp. carminata]
MMAAYAYESSPNSPGTARSSPSQRSAEHFPYQPDQYRSSSARGCVIRLCMVDADIERWIRFSIEASQAAYQCLEAVWDGCVRGEPLMAR